MRISWIVVGGVKGGQNRILETVIISVVAYV